MMKNNDNEQNFHHIIDLKNLNKWWETAQQSMCMVQTKTVIAFINNMKIKISRCQHDAIYCIIIYRYYHSYLSYF